MKFTIHPEAKIEISYHADYYEDKQPRLGAEFIEENLCYNSKNKWLFADFPNFKLASQ